MTVNATPTRRLRTLTLAALGIVYGDIGTSPLYAFKEAFAGAHPLPLTEANVLATLSTMLWAVMLIISVKYVWVVLRFDNDGEGGVLALTALAHRLTQGNTRLAATVVSAGIFGAALFYGDAIITPAISVLSAVEGISVTTPQFEHWVLPITLGILVALFVIQSRGTGQVGRWFGPVTLVWFVAIGTLGACSIARTPMVLAALNPAYAVMFAYAHPQAAFLLLSAVFLALTGGEALYADMGHFGARAVRVAWYGLVFPALMLNYFGQGALVLRDASAVQNPFYFLAPDWLLLPLVVLATAATVIASQATISGAFSITSQAARLGYLPRVRTAHTSDHERGQIYVPSVNWLMLVAVLVLVLQFRSSSALAAAYGIAVSGTMIITTILAAIVILSVRGARQRPLLLAFAVFGVLEVGFFGSNLTKLVDGGWFPLLLGVLIFALLTTWKEGTRLVALHRQQIDIPMRDFIDGPAPDVPLVPGTAVYLTSEPTLVPSALFHNLKHYKVLHQTTVFLHVITEETPYAAERVKVTVLTPNMYQLELRFGFREEPDIPNALNSARLPGLEFTLMATSYFVARTLIVDGPGDLPRWRCAIFAWMTRQAESAATYFCLPGNGVVELGTQVLL